MFELILLSFDKFPQFVSNYFLSLASVQMLVLL